MTEKETLASYEAYLRGLTDMESGSLKSALRRNPLYVDFSEHPQEIEPWKEKSKYVPFLFQIWNETKETLLPVFQTRKSRCDQNEMLKGIACLIAAFHWTAGERVASLDWSILKTRRFPAEPINWAERTAFILTKPTQFHSFIQLDELMTEMNKQFHKYEAMNKS